MDFDLFENVIMLLAAIMGLLLTLYKYFVVPKRGWLYLAVFFLMHLLSDYYWTIYTLVMGENPDVSAQMAYFGWNVGYVFLFLVVIHMRQPEVKGYFHPLMILPVPINIFQFFIYIQYGGLFNNIYEGCTATLISCACLQSVLYYVNHRKEGLHFPWTHLLVLLFITSEYGMWTSSCYGWENDALNPYYYFAIMDSVLLIFFSAAVGNDYRNRNLIFHEKNDTELRLQLYFQIIVSSIVLFGCIGGYNVAHLMKRAVPADNTDPHAYDVIASTLFGISILLVVLVLIVIVMIAMRYKIVDFSLPINLYTKWSRFNLFFTIMITFCLMIFSIIYTSRLFYSVSVEGLMEDGKSKVTSVANNLENYLGVARSVLWVTADTVDLMVKNGVSQEEISSYITAQTMNQSEQFDENFTGLYAYINGEYIDGSGWNPPAEYNVEVRDWYRAAVDAKGETIIVSPYVDAQTHSVVVTICKLLDDGGKEGDYHHRQVVALDLVVNHIQDVTDEISIADKGYGMVLNKDGMIISHYNHELNGENMIDIYGEDVFSSIINAKSRTLDATLDCEKCTLFAKEVIGQWIVVIAVSDFELFKEVYSQLVVNIIVSLIVFIFISFFYYLSYKSEQINNQRMEELNANRQKQEYEARVLKLEKQAADEANSAKSRFLAYMSHEIRTPIHAILGMNEMVMRVAKDDTLREYSKNIMISGKNLLQIINSILDFSKIEDGKMDIVPASYDLSNVILYLVNSIRDIAKEKHLDFIVNVEPSLPRTLYGDDARINQIIMNLLTNAVKYTHEGSVTLTFKYLKKDADRALIHVEVQDTGIGIKESDMEKLYESFERLDKEKNRNIEGTGLGISITTSLLKLMGSELKVESTYGKGSVFYFDLWQKIEDEAPIGDYRTAETELTEDDSSDYLYAPDAHILVVDDTSMNLHVVTGLLERTAIKIDTAISGKEALDLATANNYDIILLDQKMPVMDGPQTLAAIRSDENGPNKETPVICLTADAVHGTRERLLSEGFNDYMSKPIDGRTLEQTLRKYLSADLVKKPPVTEEESSQPADTAGPVSFVSKLADAGFDTENGIKNCIDVNLYQKILEDYIREAQDRRAKICEAYDAGNWKNYSIYMHALKSTSRTIGAVELAEIAFTLERAGADSETDIIYREHDRTMDLFEKTVDILRDSLN